MRFVALLLLFLSACTSEMPKVPGDVIPPDKMVLVLADIHLADAIAETKAQQGANEQQVSEQLYVSIFKNYDISRQMFDRSLRFYEQSPEWINKMYEDVQTAISKRQNELNTKPL